MTILQAGSSQSSELPEESEWKAGGRTVFFSALGYGSGPVLFLTTASVFVRPTMEATGWSSSEVLLSPLVTVCLTFLGPLVGRVVDRRGTKQAVMIGLLPYIVLLAVFAMTPVSKITYYGLAVGIGIFGAFGYQIPYNRAVASWFDKGAGKAFGIVGVGAAAMPLLGIPLVTAAIYGIGWQAGYLVLACFAAFIALPAALIGMQERGGNEVCPTSDDASDECQHGDNEMVGAPIGKVLRTGRFWIFSFHIFLVGGAASAFLANMQPLLLDGGLGIALATTVTTLFTAGIVAGRLVAGILMDMVNRYWVAIGVFLLAMLGALAFANVATLPIAIILAAALLAAAGQGAEGDIGAYFILKEYGRKNFATLYATAGVMGGVSALIFPYIFSYIRDISGIYAPAAYVGASLYAAGALMILVYGLTGRRGNKPGRGPRRLAYRAAAGQ